MYTSAQDVAFHTFNKFHPGLVCSSYCHFQTAAMMVFSCRAARRKKYSVQEPGWPLHSKEGIQLGSHFFLNLHYLYEQIMDKIKSLAINVNANNDQALFINFLFYNHRHGIPYWPSSAACPAPRSAYVWAIKKASSERKYVSNPSHA
jgi:hypothetical protein